MACSDDQQPNFKHFCRVCKKGFMCGRALGGHMRAHGVGDDIEDLEDGDPTADWGSSQETDEEDDGCGHPGGGGSGWCKRKRSARVCASENDEDIALAKCLMALSNTRVDLMDVDPGRGNPIFSPVILSSFTKTSPSSLDKGKGVVATAGVVATTTGTTTPKGLFECKACKKVFTSHQALGGHRASHKNVKGCFATRNDEFNENSLDDQDGITGGAYQPDYEPSTSPALSGRKSKVHKCSICNRIFASGQALGGHKRCHWLTSNYTSDTYISNKFNFHEHIEQLHQRALALPKLDLKLNLPVSGNATTTTATRQERPMNAKDNGEQDNHVSATTVESLDDEGESKVKMAKLSELKDMNNANGSSSSWLQVGIGSVTNMAPDP